jgi:pilus assembly protein Flp/PilA
MTPGRIGETDMTEIAARFLRDETGATAIEYGMIAAGIGAAIAAAVFSLGGTVFVDFWNRVATAVAR